MSRKDYILIAEVLRVEYKRACLRDKDKPMEDRDTMGTVWDVTESMADSLRRDNSRFDREHFLAVVHGEKELLSRPARGAR